MNQKISEMAEILGADVADGDLFQLVDISVSSGIKNRKITKAQLSTVFGGGVPSTITVASDTVTNPLYLGMFTGQTGDRAPKTNPNLLFDPVTATLQVGESGVLPGKLALFDTVNGEQSLFTAGDREVALTGGAAIGFSVTGAFAGGSLLLTKTTEQVRIRYDASNYLTITVASNGVTTINATGSAPAIVIPDAITAAAGISTLATAFSLNDYVNTKTTTFALAQGNGTAQTITIPAGATTLVGTGLTQTLSNKDFSTAVLPSADDSVAAGSSSKQFTGLFLGNNRAITWGGGGTLAGNSTGLFLFEGSGAEVQIGSDGVDGALSLFDDTNAEYATFSMVAGSCVFSSLGGIFQISHATTPILRVGDAAVAQGQIQLPDTASANYNIITGVEEGISLTHQSSTCSLTLTGQVFTGTSGSSGGVYFAGGTSGGATLTVNPVAGAPLIYLPTLATTLTGNDIDNQLGENAGFLLDAALSADGKYCAVAAVSGTAGATLAFGDVCYLAAADSRWELADASAAATAGDVLLGICILAAAADGSATRIMLIGKIRADAVFPSMTISAPIYLSETAGDITGTMPATSDAVVRRLGWAITADELFFNPSSDYDVVA